MEFEWKPGSKLSSRVDDDATVIAGNAEGLASLADHLLRLAAEEAPSGAERASFLRIARSTIHGQ
jgi:hypothetical protein